MLTKLTEKNRRRYRSSGGGMSYDHLRLRLEIMFDMLKYIMSTSADHTIVNFFAKAWEAVEPRELHWVDQSTQEGEAEQPPLQPPLKEGDVYRAKIRRHT